MTILSNSKNHHMTEIHHLDKKRYLEITEIFVIYDEDFRYLAIWNHEWEWQQGETNKC